VSTLAIILIAFAVVALLLFAGGFIASGRRARARDAHLREQIEAADKALAEARADDRGWDLDVLLAAARQAYASRSEGREPEELHLIQVVDRPGTDADEAVFRAVDGSHEHDVVLGREGGQWVAR
jgi:type II secretory pathway pseudopilin PulG